MTAAPAGRRLVGNAVLTGVAQGVAMLAGGVLAVLVAARIGTNAETDGFFAAFSVYSVAQLLASSTRVSVVARLVEGERWEAFDRFVGAGVVLWLAAGVLALPLGGIVAALLTGDLPDQAQDTARMALLVLWPAVAGQLFAALGSAMLATLDDFAVPALAFGGGGLVSILAFLVLEGSLGIDGVGVAMLLGSLVSALVVGVALVRAGWKPRRVGVRDAVSSSGLILLASMSFLATQLGFVVTIAVAARLGEGTVTVFTYAFTGMTVLIALLGSSVAMVLAAPLAKGWDRRPESLLPHHDAVVRSGVLVLAPVVAAIALVGDEIGDVVLAAFSRGEVDQVVELLLLMIPGVVAALVFAVTQTALFALSRYRAIAVTTLLGLALQVVVALVAGAVESDVVLAVAVSAGLAASMLGALWLIAPSYVALALARLVPGMLRVALPAAVAFGLAALVLPDVAALVVGAVAYAAAVWFALPRERDLVLRLLPVAR